MKNDKIFSGEDLSERQKRIEKIGIESLKRAGKYRPTPEGHESKADTKVVLFPNLEYTPTAHPKIIKLLPNVNH